MANSPQAKKRARQNQRRLEINKARRSRTRTYVRKVEEAIASGDKDAAQAALRRAQPELMRGAQKGVLHKNTASRKISRLASRIGQYALLLRDDYSLFDCYDGEEPLNLNGVHGGLSEELA